MAISYAPTPLVDRINRFLAYRPNTNIVPVHPDDYVGAKILLLSGAFGDPKWQIAKIGEIHKDLEDEEDQEDIDTITPQ